MPPGVRCPLSGALHLVLIGLVLLLSADSHPDARVADFGTAGLSTALEPRNVGVRGPPLPQPFMGVPSLLEMEPASAVVFAADADGSHHDRDDLGRLIAAVRLQLVPDITTDAIWAATVQRLFSDALPLVPHAGAAGVVATLGLLAEHRRRWHPPPTADTPLLSALCARLCHPSVSPRLGPAQWATALWALGKLGIAPPFVVSCAATRLLQRGTLQRMRSPDFVRVLHGMAMVRATHHRLVHAMAAHAVQAGLVARLAGRELAVVVGSLGPLGVAPDPLLAALAQRLASAPLDPSAVASLLRGCASLGPTGRAPLLPPLLQRLATPGFLPSLPSPASVATIAWALAALRVSDERVVAALSQCVLHPDLLPTCTPQQLASLAWAYATLPGDARPVLAAIAHTAQLPHTLVAFRWRDAAHLLRAVAKADVPSPALLAALAQAVLSDRLLPPCTPEAVAQLLKAYADMGVLIPDLMARLADRLLWGGRLAAMAPAPLASIAGAYAALGVRNEALLAALGARLAEPGVADQLDPAAAATLAYAFAKFGIAHDTVLAAATRMAADPARPLRPQTLLQLAQAFAQVGRSNEFLVAAAAAYHTDNQTEAMNARDLADVLGAYARLGLRPPQLLAALTSRAPQPAFLRACRPAHTAALLWACASLRCVGEEVPALVVHAEQSLRDDPWPTKALAKLAWAAATLEVRNDRLWHSIATRVAEDGTLVGCSPQTLANLAWALAKVGRPPGPAALRALARRLHSPVLLRHASAQAIANSLWALATLSCQDPKPFWAIAALLLENRPLLASFNAQELANTAWAFATAGIRSDALMAAVADRIAEDEVACQLDSQNTANVLWAFATLAVPPTPGLLNTIRRQLQDPAIVSSLQLQAVSTLAWAYAALDAAEDAPLAALLAAAAALVPPAQYRHLNLTVPLCQLQAAILHVRRRASDLPRCLQFLETHGPFCQACQAQFAGLQVSAKRSALQSGVAEVLRSLLVPFEEEARLEGILVDFYLPSLRLVVEVDGPHHFVSTQEAVLPSGSTLLKRRLLQWLRYRVVAVAYYDWAGLSVEDKKRVLWQQMRAA
eukprot:EG_transcript_1361